MISDPTNGNIVNAVPVSLTEGETSTPLTLRVAPEFANAKLSAMISTAAKIKARISPNSFQDIAVTPLDLSAYFGSHVDIDFEVVAAADLPGVTRLILSALIPKQTAAAWQA